MAAPEFRERGMSESIYVAGRGIRLRAMGVREVVERMARPTELAAEFEVTYRSMSPHVAMLASLRDAGPNRKERRAAEAKARRRA